MLSLDRRVSISDGNLGWSNALCIRYSLGVGRRRPPLGHRTRPHGRGAVREGPAYKGVSSLIWRMNPLGLDPGRFEIAEDEEGSVVGCCQLEKLPEQLMWSLRTLIVRSDMRWALRGIQMCSARFRYVFVRCICVRCTYLQWGISCGVNTLRGISCSHVLACAMRMTGTLCPRRV
eukprot:jgi/Botrbrau1/17644/Bobra.0166s0075.4